MRNLALTLVAVFAMLACCHAFAPVLARRQISSLEMFTGSSNTPFHHVAIKTRDIEMAIKFYTLLDFEVENKFLAGNARAAWLQQETGGVRIELIEVPRHMLEESQGQRRRAVDLVERSELLGMNHYAIDVTTSMKRKNMKQMQQWIDYLNDKSKDAFGKTLRMAVEPMEQMIGQHLYQLAFIYDADGAIIEFVYQQKRFSQEMISGWYV